MTAEQLEKLIRRMNVWARHIRNGVPNQEERNDISSDLYLAIGQLAAMLEVHRIKESIPKLIDRETRRVVHLDGTGRVEDL